MNFFRRYIVGLCRIVLRLEKAEMFFPTIRADVRLPLPGSFVEGHTFESALARATKSYVSLILRMGAWAKIRLSVIQRIVSDVVAFASEHFGVHTNDPSVGSPSLRVETSRVRTPVGKPVELHQPIKVFGIDDGILPLRERNVSVRLFEWLGDFVSDHTTFWHESSAKGFVLPGHFTMCGSSKLI